jgi:hypothetical protein
MWYYVIYGNNSQLLVPPSEVRYNTEQEAIAAGGELANKVAPMLGLIPSVHAGRTGNTP